MDDVIEVFSLKCDRLIIHDSHNILEFSLICRENAAKVANCTANLPRIFQFSLRNYREMSHCALLWNREIGPKKLQ